MFLNVNKIFKKTTGFFQSNFFLIFWSEDCILRHGVGPTTLCGCPVLKYEQWTMCYGEDLSEFKSPSTVSRVTKVERCHSGTERSGVIETIIFCMDSIESSRLSWMTECSLRSFVYRLSSIVYRLSSFVYRLSSIVFRLIRREEYVSYYNSGNYANCICD